MKGKTCRETAKHASLAILLAVMAVVFISPVPAAEAAVQAVYYASPTGSGSSCTQAAPCSLTGVRDKVRTVNAGMTGDIAIELRGGTYTLTAPLVLDYRDSGSNGYKVIWRKYAAEAPVISGGQSLSGGWLLHDSTANIYKKTGVTSRFRQLYVNDTPAVRARIPNRTDTETFGPYYDTVSADPAAKTYTVNKSEIANWSNLAQVEMAVQPHWYHNRLRISSFTTDSGYSYVSFQTPEANSAFTKAASFYASNAYHWENAYELLDAAGEWYLDTTANTLYYKPRSGENMATAAVTAPQADTLLQLAGTSTSPVHHVEFSGLAFKYTGWNGPSSSGLVATQAVRPINGIAVPAAVQAAYGHHLRFIGNTWSSIGANGLQLRIGVKDTQIVSNHLSYVAANGIVLDDNGARDPAAADRTENILVGNNTITRVGQQYSNGMGIVAYFIRNSVIEHNSISYGPYTGMQIGGQSCSCESGMADNQIRYNDVHHMLQLHDDGGGIYTLARQPGTWVFENYVHDIARSPWAMGSPVAALYLDNYSQYITVEHNVVSGIGTGAQSTYEQTGIGAANNTWLNNGTQDQTVKDQAGVKAGYVEPIMGSSSSAAAVNENFNSSATGSPPAGWGFNTSGGTVTVQEVPSAADKSLLVSKPASADSVAAEKSFAGISGISAVEVRIRPEQTANWKMAPYLKDSSGNTAVSIAFDGGNIKLYNGSVLETVGPFTAGVWYTVRIVSDTDTDRFDLYVNGVLRKRSAAMRTAVNNVGKVLLSVGPGHTGAFYADDVTVSSP
ncbi:MAG: right-handed parallel beta-helix repeat-containing protein [Paenibacillaceae bacterium]|jgi:hypothetical protein|nr:right-handed parallel beta-helix repeat-containing protein [Paenibacillaceae bacterium]